MPENSAPQPPTSDPGEPSTGRCWAMRTDWDNCELIWEELQSGRLRQGWGHAATQDLRRIRKQLSAGKNLAKVQKESWGNRKMLSEEGGIQVGDLVLLPNLPARSEFVIVQITGDYSFSPIPLDSEQDLHELGQDYGHVLEVVAPGTAGSFGYDDERIDQRLRRSLTCRSRFWSLNAYADNVRELFACSRNESFARRPRELERVLSQVVQHAIDAGMPEVRRVLRERLAEAFRAAEFEHPCQRLLEHLYPFAEVERTAGPTEQGADFVVTWQDPLDDSDSGAAWRLCVQAKCWDDPADNPRPLEQLRTAHQAYGRDAVSIRGHYIFSAANTETDRFRQAREALAGDLGVPVGFVGIDKLVDHLSRALLSNWTGVEPV